MGTSAGISGGEGGAPVSGTSGSATTPETQGGAAGAGATADEVPWATLFGNYDLLLGAPTDATCESPLLHEYTNFGLQGSSGYPEARLFRDFRWAGWPEEVTVESDTLVVRAGPNYMEQDELWGDPALELSFTSEGFAGRGTAHVQMDCDGIASIVEVPAYITPDERPPVVRTSTTLAARSGALYPFSWLMFRFSEPLGFTGAEWPFGSVMTIEQGEGLVDLIGADGTPVDVHFEPWPFGPVAGMVFTDRDQANGWSGYVRVIGEEADDAGHPLQSDGLLLSVLDVGPSAPRFDFDEEHPGVLTTATQFLASDSNTLCEGSGGCVLLEQPTSDCSDSGEPLEVMGALAFRLSLSNAQISGMLLRYRVLSDSADLLTQLRLNTGDVEYEFPLAQPTELPTPLGDWTHASPWSTLEIQSAMGPLSEFPTALELSCQVDRQALVVEWVEAVSE